MQEIQTFWWENILINSFQAKMNLKITKMFKNPAKMQENPSILPDWQQIPKVENTAYAVARQYHRNTVKKRNECFLVARCKWKQSDTLEWDKR